MGSGSVTNKSDVKKAADAEKAFQNRLRQGGQKIKLTGKADIYERRGETLAQINSLGSRPKTRAILSNRLQLSNHLRGIGNLYGASVELLHIGPSGDFLREVVDGGQVATGGTSPHILEASQRVQIAQAALSSLRVLRHKPNSGFDVGAHRPIRLLDLINLVCVQGADVREVAITNGWFIRKGNSDQISIPKQQSQKLKAALVEGLKAIDDAWAEADIWADPSMSGIEVG